jgi:pyruvate/2-oxoglutarate dehydrogenase complex dihydrolipoamide dehydrogenase (E3) component
MQAGAFQHVLVLGAGPAGVAAALRAADLGAKTTLITRDEFGGMAANDGPIPVRTLAHAARLLREARQLERYGIATSALALDYSKLLSRVREVVGEARGHAAFREQIDAAGVVVQERTGAARFVDAHTIETASGLRLRADKIVICTSWISVAHLERLARAWLGRQLACVVSGGVQAGHGEPRGHPR